MCLSADESPTGWVADCRSTSGKASQQFSAAAKARGSAREQRRKARFAHKPLNAARRSTGQDALASAADSFFSNTFEPRAGS
jgi:hypothetical protein